MRKIKIFIILTILVLASSLSAQEESTNKYGFGVNLYSNRFGSLFSNTDLTSFYVTMQVGETFRIEPEIGLLSVSIDENNGDKISFSEAKLGLGLFYVVNPNKTTSLFVGPRIGFLRYAETEDESGSEESMSATDFYIGLCTGAEHHFSKHFSLGGEIQLEYIKCGKISSTSDSIKSFGHNALLTVRWYFN